MTTHEIADYISYETADHSKNKLTKVIYKDGAVLMGHLSSADQDHALSRTTNKWKYRTLDGRLIEIDGDQIAQLKVG